MPSYVQTQLIHVIEMLATVTKQLLIVMKDIDPHIILVFSKWETVLKGPQFVIHNWI